MPASGHAGHWQHISTEIIDARLGPLLVTIMLCPVVVTRPVSRRPRELEHVDTRTAGTRPNVAADSSARPRQGQVPHELERVNGGRGRGVLSFQWLTRPALGLRDGRK